MRYPTDNPDFDPCDACSARVGALTLYQGLWLCRSCLANAVEADTLQRLPTIAWEETL